MSVEDVLLRLLAVMLLIAINAFFVTAEFAMVSVRRSRITQLVKAGDTQAQTVQSLQKSIDRLLSTTQLGITLSSLALGWIGEGTMGKLMRTLITKLPLSDEIGMRLSHSLAIPLAFVLVAYLQIVLGELCPKSLALIYAEEVARFLGPAVGAIARFFTPFIWILNQSTKFLLRWGGKEYAGQRWYNQVTPEELRLIINTEKESSGLEAAQRKLLDNVFELGDISAIEVMVPRNRIKTIGIDAKIDSLLTEVANSKYSRYPVTGESEDDICGVIDFKDLALGLAKGEIKAETAIEAWVKPIQFVPEATLLNELLKFMQQQNLNMVMLVNEFGRASGLVTIQDVIAEIIGNTPQELNAEDIPFQIIDERSFLVQAQMNLEEVNEVLNLNLPLMDEYQTLGGLMLYLFQKIPIQGEQIEYGNLHLTVEKIEGRRLKQILIQRIESANIQNSQVVSIINNHSELSVNERFNQSGIK